MVWPIEMKDVCNLSWINPCEDCEVFSFFYIFIKQELHQWNWEIFPTPYGCCEQDPDMIVCHANQVTKLNLSGKLDTRFSEIPDETFRKLEHLRHLDLSNNYFSGEFVAPFEYLLELTYLDCSSNRFSGINKVIQNLKKLVFI
jgi:Leucine-rich repeat (LRR) protein